MIHYISRYKINGEQKEEVFSEEREFLKLCGKLFALEDSEINGFYHITSDGDMRKIEVSMANYKIRVGLTFPFKMKDEMLDSKKIYVYSSYKGKSEVESYDSIEEVNSMLEELSLIEDFEPKFALEVNFQRKEYKKTDLTKELSL